MTHKKWWGILLLLGLSACQPNAQEEKAQPNNPKPSSTQNKVPPKPASAPVKKEAAFTQEELKAKVEKMAQTILVSARKTPVSSNAEAWKNWVSEYQFGSQAPMESLGAVGQPPFAQGAISTTYYGSSLQDKKAAYPQLFAIFKDDQLVALLGLHLGQPSQANLPTMKTPIVYLENAPNVLSLSERQMLEQWFMGWQSEKTTDLLHNAKM